MKNMVENPDECFLQKQKRRQARVGNERVDQPAANKLVSPSLFPLLSSSSSDSSFYSQSTAVGLKLQHFPRQQETSLQNVKELHFHFLPTIQFYFTAVLKKSRLRKLDTAALCTWHLESKEWNLFVCCTQHRTHPPYLLSLWKEETGLFVLPKHFEKTIVLPVSNLNQL